MEKSSYVGYFDSWLLNWEKKAQMRLSVWDHPVGDHRSDRLQIPVTLHWILTPSRHQNVGECNQQVWFCLLLLNFTGCCFMELFPETIMLYYTVRHYFLQFVTYYTE